MQPVNELSYNQALSELEKILGALRGEDCDVDRLTEMTARAVELLNHCRNRLTTTDTELRKILDSLQGWGFNATEVNETTNLPILAWQSGKPFDTSAVAEIEVSEDVPAVYYNLQGVQIASPENGIYIVRRGDKVTKELVK